MFEMIVGWLIIILALLYFFGENFDATRAFTARNKTMIGWALIILIIVALFMYFTAGTLVFNNLWGNTRGTRVSRI